ncbi:hypothetical protein FD754_011274, partial [Muntiacus muntjak]
VSEKAANIAWVCRQQEALFQLLTEEKKEAEKNKICSLGKIFFGKESNEFATGFEEKIIMRLCPTEEEPVDLLSTVLNGDNLSDPALDSIEINILQDILEIWVDPIDSTYQYIKGSAGTKPNQGIFPRGLQCITVLIGVYDIQTGVPLMGVINQPFNAQCYWGLPYMGTHIHSLLPPISTRNKSERQSQVTQIPSSECSLLFSALIACSVTSTTKGEHCHMCVQSASSGQLGLVPRACVFLGLVDIYIFSKDTTFRWCSCAAHAILGALGGGMVDLKECPERHPDMGLDLPRLVYHMGNEGAARVDQWPAREDSLHTDQSSSWRHS